MAQAERKQAPVETRTPAPEGTTDSTENLELLSLDPVVDPGSARSPRKVPQVTPRNIIALQRTFGNRTVQRLIKNTVQRAGPSQQQVTDVGKLVDKIHTSYKNTRTEVNKLTDDSAFKKDIRDKQVNDAVNNSVKPWVDKTAEDMISASVIRYIEDEANKLTASIERYSKEISQGAQETVANQQLPQGSKTPNKDQYIDLASKAKAKELSSEKGQQALAKQLKEAIAEAAAKKALKDNIEAEIKKAVDETKPPIEKMVDKKVTEFRKKNSKEAITELRNLQQQNLDAHFEKSAFGKLDDANDDIQAALKKFEEMETGATHKSEYIVNLVKAVDAVAKSAAGAEARDQRRPAARKIQGLLKSNETLRRKIKKEAKDKAFALLKSTKSSEMSEFKDIKNKIIRKEVEGDLGSKFDWIGSLIDAEVPREGSRGILEITIQVPVHPGVFVQVRFLGDVKREDGKIKMNAEATFGAGGGFGVSGFKLEAVGELGGRLEIETDKGGPGAMRLLSYGLYRKGRESYVVPDKLIDALWGMSGDSGKTPYEEAEAWGKMMEEGMGGSDFVDLGAMAVFSAKGDFTVAKANLRTMFFTGVRYNKEYIDYKRKYKKGGEHKARAFNKLVGGQGKQKSVGKEIMMFEIGGKAEVGAGPLLGFGGEIKGKLYFEPFKLRTKASRFTKKEVEIAAFLKVPTVMSSTEDVIKGLVVWLPGAMKLGMDTVLSGERAVESEQTGTTETNKAQAVGQTLGTMHNAASLATWEAVNLTNTAMQGAMSNVLKNVLGASTTLKLILKITDSRDKPLEVNVYLDMIQGLNVPIGVQGTGIKIRFDKSDRLINFKLAPAFEVIGLR